MNPNFIRALFLAFATASTPTFAEEISDNSADRSSEPATIEENAAADLAQVPEEPAPLPLMELRKFADVFNKIKLGYVEEIDDQTLLNYAIKGMLSGLDPHSAYLEPTAFTNLKESTSGSFGGVGIEVGMENGFVKVIAPIDETPAQLGGILAGDLIIELDDKPVKGMSLNQAVEKMRGDVGTDITLDCSLRNARAYYLDPHARRNQNAERALHETR